MHGFRKIRRVVDHELAHVLAAYSDQIGYISQSNKIRACFDKRCTRKGFVYILHGTENGHLC